MSLYSAMEIVSRLYLKDKTDAGIQGVEWATWQLCQGRQGGLFVMFILILLLSHLVSWDRVWYLIA